MTETVKTLLQEHGLSNGEVFTRPVFPRATLNMMEDGEKRLVLAEILEVYDRLIGQMVSRQPEEAGLRYLQKEVQRLKNHKYQKYQLVHTMLDQLANIQTNNSVVQSKALWELPWLYDAASSLVGRKRRSLRRQELQRRRRVQLAA